MRSKYLKILLVGFGLLLFSNVQAGYLHQAVFNGNIESVKSLLDYDANINQLGRKFGYGSPLHLAVRGGYLNIVQLLIERGAVVDVRDQNDYTPLHNAAWNGNLVMVKLLLDAGADITAHTYEGYTPLSCAYRNSQVEVIEFIEGKLQLAIN